MTILWAAATFIILEMTVDAIAAIILVPAAACGGLHAGEWPARPLQLQVMNPSARTGQTMSLIMRDALIAKAHSSTMSPTGLIAETQ